MVSDAVQVLPPFEVKSLLAKLKALLAALPSTLPLNDITDSRYGPLVGFVPDSELVEDLGEAGAINTGFVRIFGHRKDGLKIIERGPAIESIAPLLNQYLNKYTGDTIIQKWLLDLVHAARELHPKRLIKQTEKARDAELKRKRAGEPDASSSTESNADSSASEDYVNISDSELEIPSLIDSNASPRSPPPARARRSLGKSATGRKKAVKAKKKKKPAPAYDAVPAELDDRYDDAIPIPSTRVSRGGAPRNELVDQLVISCYPKGGVQGDDSHRFRCVASSICGWTLQNTKRQIDRILKHSSRCAPLQRWKPEIHSRTEVEYVRRAPSAAISENIQKANVKAVNETAISGASVSAAVDATSFFAPFNKQGQLDTTSRINLAIVRLLCSAGIPPRIANSSDWDRLFNAIAPRLVGYSPPSSTTLRDKLIPAEARSALLNMRRFLSTHRNLSLSFDGLTEGDQPVYTVHICTPDRHCFLLRGDIFYGSHNSAYITDLLERVILEIGIEHIASVVSDDINATKKARRDLAAKCPTIMNLADPCHKFNLVISDVSADEMFNEVVSPMKSVLTHFKHSPQATGILNDIRKILQITTGLKSVGQTRFATLKISAESVIECMPALYKMNKDGYLTHAPEIVQKKLVKVVDPFARALMCLESTHSTIADNHIFWMAALSMVDELFRTPDGSFSEAEVQQLRGKINQRFDETINEPPNDVYILGSFGDPRMRNQEIYKNSNPLRPTITLRVPSNAPRRPNSSPCNYLPNSVWARVRKSAINVLKAELTLAETCPQHPLANYDALQAKNELDALLVQYACLLYPFEQALGDRPVLAYWRAFLARPDTMILAFIFVKIFSVIPNSMNDERTGSRMTFLFSKLRSRTDASTMVEQIQVKQWYELVDASTGKARRPKARPVMKFRDLKPAPSSSSSSSGFSALPVSLDDEDGDDWLSETARAAARDIEKPEIGTHNHLDFLNLEALSLTDVLADTPPVAGDTSTSVNTLNVAHEAVRRAADVDWD